MRQGMTVTASGQPKAESYSPPLAIAL